MRDGFPRSVVSLLVALFVASLVGPAGWVAYFASDAAFFGRPGALGGLWLTAALSGGVVLSSWLLAFHYERSDYTSGEEVKLGRYAFAPPAGPALRPLRDPASPGND
jgi:hypothetical protein